MSRLVYKQPKRALYTRKILVCHIFTVLFLISVIFSPLALVTIIWSVVLYKKRSRFPVVKIKCPSCGFKNKVEPQVTSFSCEYCFNTIDQSYNTTSI